MPLPPVPENALKHVLETIGIHHTDDLFATLPPKIRENATVTIPALTEQELRRHMQTLAHRGAIAPEWTHFLGGGTYDAAAIHPTPHTGADLNPLLAGITQMPVIHTGFSDAAIATALTCLAAVGANHSVALAASLPPDIRHTVTTFLQARGLTPLTVGFDASGTLALNSDAPPAVLVIGYPNYFGIIEPTEIIKAALPRETKIIAAVSDPTALSIFAPPAADYDYITGDLQSLGSPMAFGGSRCGFVASHHAMEVTTIPSRITSRAAAYLTALGAHGFQTLGENLFSRFDYLAKELEANGIPLKFKSSTHFREGMFEVPNLTARFAKAVSLKKIPGIQLAGKAIPHPDPDFFSLGLLICVHSQHTKTDLDALIEVISNG